mgnify:CR=1 FL=1
MSDTPRTESVREANIGHPLRMIRMIEHARQLERKLRESQADLGAAQHELDVWQSMACSLAERLKMFGLCIPPEQPFGWQELLADFEKLKGVKP